MATQMSFFSMAICFAAVALAFAPTFSKAETKVNNPSHLGTTERMPKGRTCLASICFALDGSNSVPPQDYALSKQFVQEMARRVLRDGRAENPGRTLSAVQYGVANIAISPSTTDLSEFLDRVQASEQGQSVLTSIVAGISYCFSETFQSPGSNNNIIILGEGSTNFGSDAVDRADLFREVGGEVISIAVGRSPNARKLGALAETSPRNVFRLDSPDDVEAAVESVLDEVCQ